MKDKDYAQRISKLRMLSIQRRHERYKILYAYKIKEGLVPNISKTHGLKFTSNKRLGCRCEIPYYQIKGKAMKARENLFALTACRLWNSLPKRMRDINGKDLPHFKRKLDKVLSYYPDVPQCSHRGHAYDGDGHRSNLLRDHYLSPAIRREMEDCLRSR